MRKSLLALTLLTSGCAVPDNWGEDFAENGSAFFIDKPHAYGLSVCNDATFMGSESEQGLWTRLYRKPLVDYVGRKSTFVEGEPVKFVLVGRLGIASKNLIDSETVRIELIRNGEIDLNRRFSSKVNDICYIVPYPNLERGNYTVSCFRGLKDFLGKIDFQVVAPPEKTENYGGFAK